MVLKVAKCRTRGELALGPFKAGAMAAEIPAQEKRASYDYVCIELRIGPPGSVATTCTPPPPLAPRAPRGHRELGIGNMIIFKVNKGRVSIR